MLKIIQKLISRILKLNSSYSRKIARKFYNYIFTSLYNVYIKGNYIHIQKELNLVIYINFQINMSKKKITKLLFCKEI